MLHFISLSRKTGAKRCIRLGILAVILFSCATSFGAETTKKNVIGAVTLQHVGNNVELSISGSTEPTYTIYELFKPSRIVVDIAESELETNKSFALPADSKIQLKTESIQNGNPPVTRFEFALPHSYAFTTKQDKNNIIISIANFTQSEKQNTSIGSADLSAGADKATSKSIDKQLPQINPLAPVDEAPTAATAMEENFNFSGYNKEHITVDFYKIDLHNVFRLLREVSGVNIVVDESVAGSLTLALNDVPWDFALDIILNLKNLQKEERFNTIVIHPKSKVFDWPERAVDNLSFEADENVATEESLVIQQQQNVSPVIVEAKKLIAKGRHAEQKGNIETAAGLYEQALKKWPKNGRLANKLAAIYLVQLRQNAKAAYFADKALKIDNKNTSAALNAAIAHANMKENVLAQQYFDQSINTGKPSSAALLSYAAFSEQSSQYEAAIKLLLKHDQIYGQTLESMIARARTLDKKGDKSQATRVYQAIMLAGFRVPPDLRKFITERTHSSQIK